MHEEAASQWTVVDATRNYERGQRVPFGAKICLQSSKGTNLSAVPDSNVRFSPNCSEWEWWTTQQR